jgi:glycosyltransferase involved in cell wall biosynthesis
VTDGHDVHVLTAQPSYKAELDMVKQPNQEVIEGVHVGRLDIGSEKNLNGIKRLLNIIQFSLSVFVKILFQKRYDVVMASTAPPVLIGFFACIAAKLKRSKFIYHCMDIHPELGKISGEFSNYFVYRILFLLDSLTCKMADKIVVLSEDMAKSLVLRKGGEKYRLEKINNFILPEYEEENVPDASVFMKKDGMFRVLFAGNIGRFQNLEKLIDAMLNLRSEKEIELVFLGEGSAKTYLQSQAGDLCGKNILFLGHQPYTVAKKIIKNADLCVVSLAKNVQKYAFPSKTMTYLSLGKPLLVLVDDECELSEMTQEKGVGKSIVNGDSEVIANSILAFKNDTRSHSNFEKRAIHTAMEFDENKILDIWSRLLLRI